jgi:hypothetical protein
MNTIEWPPQIGAWYLRWDKGEVFQVTGYDEKSNRALLETYDGNTDQIDQLTWDRLSLAPADPPEDWTGPLEMVDVVNFGDSSGAVSEDVADAPATPDRSV